MKLGIREVIFLGVMLALLGSSYFFVFEKADAKRRTMEADLHRKEAALVNLRQATAGVDDLDHKVTELQKAIAFFESKLPQQKEIDTILKEVSQMATANSLDCKTIKTLKSESLVSDHSANYSEQPIELSLSGNFDGFYSFMLQLEKLPRITRTTQMKLEKINGKDGEMTAHLTLSIFFEPDNTTASAQ
jgi:type IV pilus assembly protein PilO